MKFTVFLTCIFFAQTSLAEPPVFQEWSSQDGTKIEAAFSGFDQGSETVTLLVPKKVPLSKLSKDSQLLATTLAKQVSTEQQQADPQFMLSNGLADPTVAAWRQATNAEKVATCGAMVFGLVERNLASEQLRSFLSTPANVNKFTLEMFIGIELGLMQLDKDCFKYDEGTLKISQVVGALSMSKNWIRTDTRVVGKIMFSEIKIVTSGASTQLIGRVRNDSEDDLQVGIYHLNVEGESGLVAIKTFALPPLKAKSENTFSTILDKELGTPAITKLTITESNVIYSK